MVKNRISKIYHRYKRLQVSKSPQLNLVWGFFLYTIIGFALLSVPFFHRTCVGLLDNLFIATSAISTTGLVTISIFDSYNFFGQFVIMGLIQIGGIGYMTLTTYYLLYTTSNLTHWHNKIIGAEFTLPDTIQINDFIRSVVVFTIVMETLGTICFFIAFGKSDMTFWQSIWFSIFHSVSTFCTAGFGLFNNSFESYSNDYFVNTTISVLAISGSLGFIVITDIWYRIRGKSKSISFTSRIITFGFLILLSLGTILVYLTETSIKNSESRLLESFFQVMSAMTTVGFNTIPIGGLSLPILLVITFLMYIGASPSGTAGGMKITTLTAMISILKSRLFGQQKVTFLRRIIPYERLYVATSTFMLYTSTIFLFTYLMSVTEPFQLELILFEVASALGTVGLSTGITSDLTSMGKILIIILMFIGRVGVLTFGFALLERKTSKHNVLSKEDLAV